MHKIIKINIYVFPPICTIIIPILVISSTIVKTQTLTFEKPTIDSDFEWDLTETDCCLSSNRGPLSRISHCGKRREGVNNSYNNLYNFIFKFEIYSLLQAEFKEKIQLLCRFHLKFHKDQQNKVQARG